MNKATFVMMKISDENNLTQVIPNAYVRCSTAHGQSCDLKLL